MLNYYKSNKMLIFLSFFWIILWGSLNSYPKGESEYMVIFTEFSLTKKTIYVIIDTLRIYIPLFITSFILIFLLFKNLFRVKLNYFLIAFLFLFIFQLLGLINSGLNMADGHENRIINATSIAEKRLLSDGYSTIYSIIERTHLPLLCINGVIILFFLNSKFNHEKIKIIFYINLFFIILVAIAFLPLLWNDFLNIPSNYLYGTQTWKQMAFGDNQMIRVTGLARLLALLLLIGIIKLNDNISVKNKIFLIIILFFLSFNLWALQSRLVLLSLMVILIINLILLSNNKKIENFIILVLIIFASAFSYNFLIKFKNTYWANIYSYSMSSKNVMESINDCKEIKSNDVTRIMFCNKINEFDISDSSISDNFLNMISGIIISRELEKYLVSDKTREVKTIYDGEEVAWNKGEEVAWNKGEEIDVGEEVNVGEEVDKLEKNLISQKKYSHILKKRYSYILNTVVENYEEQQSSEKNRLSETVNLFKDETLLPIAPTNFAISGRNSIWKSIIKEYNYKKIFGYGPQADRFVFLKKDKNDPASQFTTNASSSLIYAFMCGGYFSFLSIIIINLYVLFLLIIYLKNKIYLKEDNFFLNSSLCIILFLGMRSIFENSYAVFSVDFMIFISTVIIFEKQLKNKMLINFSTNS